MYWEAQTTQFLGSSCLHPKLLQSALCRAGYRFTLVISELNLMLCSRQNMSASGVFAYMGLCSDQCYAWTAYIIHMGQYVRRCAGEADENRNVQNDVVSWSALLSSFSSSAAIGIVFSIWDIH